MMTDKIVWIDLEMSSLDIKEGTILEIACCITDFSLKEIIRGPNIVIKTSVEVLDGMNKWCRKTHGKSGLTDLCKESSYTIPQAEDIVLNFVKEHALPGVAPLAGNSVYYDRLFLTKHMPKLNDYLHYRIIDVSSFWETIRRWAPEMKKSVPEKSYNHRAAEDIIDSINLLRHFHANMYFKFSL